jgi:glycosyltransferase involved in cell wall biosynthesis
VEGSEVNGTGEVEPATPLVSILIACYNYQKFVRDALCSALDQTYERIEVIFVDDGSTDESLVVAQRVAEEHPGRITIISQANGGQVKAMLAGLRASRGSLICMLDADDRFCPEKVARVVDRFAQSPELVQVSHGRRFIDEFGSLLGTERRKLPEGDVTPQLLRWANYEWVVTSCLAYGREILQELLENAADHPVAVVDLHTTASAPFLGPIGAIAEPLTEYRIHGVNMHRDANRLLWREATIEVINKAAARTGRSESIDWRADNLLVLMKRHTADPPTRRESIRALARSIPEAIDLRYRPFRFCTDIIVRTTLYFSDPVGQAMLPVGLPTYLKQRAIAVVRRRI